MAEALTELGVRAPRPRQLLFAGLIAVLVSLGLTESGVAQVAPAAVALEADRSVMRPGESVVVTARVTDPSGNPVVGVTVGFASDRLLPPPSIVAVIVPRTDANGVATQTFTAPPGLAPGPATITVVAGRITGAIQVQIVGPPATVELQAEPTSVSDGGGTVLTARVTDVNGAPVGGVTVQFVASVLVGPRGQATDAAVTNAAGEAVTRFTAPPGAGPATATVTGAVRTLVATTTVEVRGAPRTIEISADPPSLDVASTTVLRIRVLDAAGSALPGVAVVIESAPLALDGPGGPSATELRTDARGEATLALYAAEAGTASVRATAGAASGSVDIDVRAVASPATPTPPAGSSTPPVDDGGGSNGLPVPLVVAGLVAAAGALTVWRIRSRGREGSTASPDVAVRPVADPGRQTIEIDRPAILLRTELPPAEITWEEDDR